MAFTGFEDSDIDPAVFGKALTDVGFREKLLAKPGEKGNTASENGDEDDIKYVEKVLARAALPHDDNTAQEIIDLREMGAEQSFDHLIRAGGKGPHDPTAAFG